MSSIAESAAPVAVRVPSAALRTIYVMWRRQLIRFVRSRSRIVAMLAQPLLFLLAFGYGFGGIFAEAGLGSYIQFLGPGIICMSILFTAMFGGMEMIWDRQFGFLKETMVAPVPRVSIMIGRTLGGASVAVLQGLLVLVITMAVGLRPENWALVPVAIVAMALVAIMFTALGTAVAARLKDMQGFPLIMNFIVMPLFFLSGALFPVDTLPDAMKFIIQINPLAYGVDAVRELLINGGHFSLWLDFAVLIGVAAIIVAVGTRLFSRMDV